MERVNVLLIILVAFLTGCSFKNKEIALYQDVFSNEKYLELYGQSSAEIRGTYAFITDDDIPELLIADGDYEASRVSVFTIENNHIKYIGTFGSACGTLKYCERESYIESVYGNHGAFFYIFSDINDGVSVIGDVFILQRMDSTVKYYADFYPDGMEGDNSFNYLSYSVPEKYEVSEEEYNNRYKELKTMKNKEWKMAEYESMDSLDELIGKLK